MLRIIPAHAGNSMTCSRFLTIGADHPRACGELRRTRFFFSPSFRSSPRMRGTRDRGVQTSPRKRDQNGLDACLCLLVALYLAKQKDCLKRFS